MDDQVKTFLSARFAETSMALAELIPLWELYHGLGLANRDFVEALTSGEDTRLWQRNWEMLLARHLHQQGHALTCVGDGPDLRFEHGGVTVWVEAVAPEPRGLTEEWLKPNFVGVGTFPHEEILLRWTTALDTKRKKLAEYQRKGVVRPRDAYVIAINGCQLGAVPVDRGISQMPFGVEAVLPVGPLAIPVDRETGKWGDAFISERFSIINANGSPVPTTPFVDPAYAGVSAVVGSAASLCYGKPLAAHVVHNPLASVPLPHGVLGAADDEWFAVPVDERRIEFDLQRRQLKN
jgi:hypothetical protein